MEKKGNLMSYEQIIMFLLWKIEHLVSESNTQASEHWFNPMQGRSIYWNSSKQVFVYAWRLEFFWTQHMITFGKHGNTEILELI